jgi:mono/diheme cytochrome c family protein
MLCWTRSQYRPGSFGTLWFTRRTSEGTALKSIWVLALAYVALTGAGYPQAPTAEPALPEGRGKAEFIRICGDCHSTSIATKLRLSPGGWTGLVDDMVSRGAQGTQDEFDRVSKYLATNFRPKAGESK